MEENQKSEEQLTENQEETTPQQETNTATETSAEANHENNCEELLSQEKDKYVRLYAEFDNYKKRTLKERTDIFKYANQDTLVSMLPVIDDFERAITQLKSEGTQENTLQGVQLIYNKLYNTLAEKGLKKIDIKPGDDFDVETQEAISQVNTEDPEMKNKIVDIVETGYKLGDKVIRYAKVVTGK